MNEKTFRLADNVSWKKMDDLVIVVDIGTGAYYSLNKTASNIWENIVSGKSHEEIKESLADIFDVEAVAAEALQTDITGCIDEWLANGLIAQKQD